MGIFSSLLKKQTHENDSTTAIIHNGKAMLKIKPFSEKLWGGYISPSGGFSNAAQFTVHGMNPKTNRRNKKVFDGVSQSDVTKKAHDLGFLDPIECEPLPFSAPTESQCTYAEKLNITFPSDFISVDDASALISRAEASDFGPTSAVLVRYASKWGLHFSRYHGNEALLRIVQEYDHDCYQLVLKEDASLSVYFEDCDE